MPLELDDVRLWGADESTNVSEANVELTSVPGDNPEENIAFSLEAVERQPLAGRATGIRLIQESGYPNDPRDALAQWIQEFISLCNANQGDGWELVDQERDRSISVAATNASWTYNAGAELEVQWDMELTRGDAFFTDSLRVPTTATPGASETLGGVDLGTVNQKRTSVDLQTETSAVAYQPRESTVITPDSGAVRSVQLTGRVGGDPQDLRDFENQLREWTPREDTLTYQSALPGTQHETVISSYDSTHNAGSPSILEYALELTEGESL